MNDTHLQRPSWFDERRWNDYQKPVWEEIMARFEEGNRLVLLNAPTGSGKSWLAEATRQSLAESGVYTVGTKSLQDQIERSFPYAKLIKGRDNYKPLDVSPDPWGTAPTCGDCDRRKDFCSFCDPVTECPYLVAKRQASSAALACTNYAYLLGSWSQDKGSIFYQADFVIADECDVLEEELMRHVSISISPRMQKRLDLEPPSHKTKEESWPVWFEYAIPHLVKQQRQIKSDSLKAKRLRRSIERLSEQMTMVATHLDAYVYDYSGGRIEFKPVTVDHIAPQVFWGKAKRFLVMSATVIPEHFIESTGFKGAWAPVFAPSTFDPARRPIYYIPSALMTKKTEAEEWPKMSKAVKVVADRYPNERVLVHSHSYGLTRELAESLEGNGRDVFYYLNARDRQLALVQFEETPGAILVAPSLERGIDLPDDLCRAVIVAKVPYASLGDKQVAARLWKTKNGEFWYAGNTAMAVVQMIGRGMRHENDQCDVIILDTMFGKFFKDWALAQGEHRFFPKYFLEAFKWDSDVRWEIQSEIKKRNNGEAG